MAERTSSKKRKRISTQKVAVKRVLRSRKDEDSVVTTSNPEILADVGNLRNQDEVGHIRRSARLRSSEKESVLVNGCTKAKGGKPVKKVALKQPKSVTKWPGKVVKSKGGCILLNTQEHCLLEQPRPSSSDSSREHTAEKSDISGAESEAGPGAESGAESNSIVQTSTSSIDILNISNEEGKEIHITTTENNNQKLLEEFPVRRKQVERMIRLMGEVCVLCSYVLVSYYNYYFSQ